MRALLDVNVLIALLDAAHVHHGISAAWLRDNIHDGWASCPITQLGCVRIMSNANYSNPQPAAQVAKRLQAAAASEQRVLARRARCASRQYDPVVKRAVVASLDRRVPAVSRCCKGRQTNHTRSPRFFRIISRCNAAQSVHAALTAQRSASSLAAGADSASASSSSSETRSTPSARRAR